MTSLERDCRKQIHVSTFKSTVFFLLFKPGAPHFHFALGSVNYVTTRFHQYYIYIGEGSFWEM